jgi:starch phosphorylase
VDVWLNTPLRPMEASGTSGMKVVANGGVNISILDGWWAEAYEPEVGWAIGSGELYDDLEYQNTVESQALYDLLEKEVVPLFFDRGPDKLPRRWIAKMKASMARLAPVFNTNRMVRQYSEQFYAPALKRWEELVIPDMQRARELAAWKRRVYEGFGAVRVEGVTDNIGGGPDGGGARVGKELRVEAVVNVGPLSPADLRVELYYGILDQDGQLSSGQALPMDQVGQAADGHANYSVSLPCIHSGMTGYTVRVLPHHPSLGSPKDMALIRWAG